MKTAVEWMVEKLFKPMDNPPIENVSDIIEQAKEMEKQQRGHSEEEVLNIIDNFCETFKVDLILRKDFNEWFEQFKNKKDMRNQETIWESEKEIIS